MSQCGGFYPTVNVVDRGAARPPLPPRLSRVRRRGGAAQIVLFLLVSLALFGIVLEAWIIYQLHQPHSLDSPQSSKMISDDGNVPPIPTEGLVATPSKPVAHLTDGLDVVHGKDIMSWSTAAGPLIHEMIYEDQNLIIQREGYYYIYSKVFFSETSVFNHTIQKNTQGYSKSITLLLSRKSPKTGNNGRSNSYLGGVFHLDKNDRLFVKVSNTSQIVRHWPYENVFGAYMI
ncbi:tumor necrosis factor ligand superfamily member 14 [Thalassophryne amazonica]|uniref:tumor necrosis factor ligand superfamily member 14 n=1 Tax=Thalassophryne amazonica TaxID=390379 RepID=UPI001471BCBF|nr:tumor necrosis factor ligand superfamily member 14 [Thalassophryne amazonica]